MAWSDLKDRTIDSLNSKLDAASSRSHKGLEFRRFVPNSALSAYLITTLPDHLVPPSWYKVCEDSEPIRLELPSFNML